MLDPDHSLARYEVDENGCWIWQGITNSVTGYGRTSSGEYAHRLSHEAYKGPIPEGLTIDHLCRVRNCINPQHLEAVTLRENILRSNNAAAINARKTHCPRGHELSPENLTPSRRGRSCLICSRAHQQRQDAKRRKGIDLPIEFYLAKGARSYVYKTA